MNLEKKQGKTGSLEARIPTKRPVPYGMLITGGALALLLLICSLAAVFRSTTTYVITDGTRMERITMPSDDDAQALEQMGFQNVTVVERREDKNTVYLSVEAVFDVSIRTAEGVFTVRSKSGSTEEILEQNGITLAPEDLVTPERETWIKKNCEIVVVRVTHQELTQNAEVPFTVEVGESDTLLKGQQRIRQRGKAGEKEQTYRVTLHDGQETARELVSERELTAPVNCVIEQGTREPQTEQEKQTVIEEAIKPSKAVLANTAPQESSSSGLSTEGRSQVWSVPAGITDDTEKKIITAGDGSSFAYTAVVEVMATAYHRVEEGGEVTASGTITRYGTVAVDPTVIPLGSEIYVVSNGGDQSWSYGPGIAEDTGGLIKGARIDLFFMTGSEADQFGVRPAKVYILKQ